MIKKLKLFFTPPVFDDQDKTLKARSSFFLAIVGSTTSIFAFIFFLLFAQQNIFRLCVIGFAIFLSLLPILMLRKGYVQSTILFQASIIWVGVVVTSVPTGGLHSIGFIGGTIAALLIMGIALERTSLLVFISASILVAGFMAWAEGRGFIYPSNAVEKPIILVVTYASFLFVLTGLLYVTYRSVAQALSQARKEITERERAEREREEVICELKNEIKERHRAEEKIGQSANQLAMLNEIGRAVAALTDLDNVLETIHQQVERVMPLDVFFVALYNPETNMVSYPLVYDHGQRWQEPDTELVPEAYSSQVLQTGKSKMVLASPEEMGRDRQQGAAIRIGDYAEVSASMIYVPMFIKGRIIGTLSAQSYTLNAYTEDHLKLLEGVANQVAIAIENARLFTNVQQELAERQRAEREARRLEELYRHAIESADAVPYYRDYRSQAYTFMGEDILKITGYTAAEITPALWASLEQEGFPRGSMAHLTYEEADRLSEEGFIENWECDYRIITRDGQTRWVADSGVKVEDEHGVRIGVIGILQDITERKRAEEMREKLIRELEQRNSELERLAYTLSHELKSPLITIGGFIGYLRQDALGGNIDRLETDIQRITDGTEKMRRLTSELIALMSVGRIAREFKEISLRELVEEAVGLVHEKIAEKNVAVKIADCLPNVRGDRKELLEVFQNLLENAIKFMGEQPEPKIEIGQRSEPGAAPLFYIRDNGMGIDSRFFGRIFGIFQKLDAQSDGTGIGLALVKRIIEVHGGRIWVESEGLGKGSTFCFTIPDNRK